MAHSRHDMLTGQVLTRTLAIEQARAPAWLKDQLRGRRQGEQVSSPRARTALIAWRDARRTVAGVCRKAPARTDTSARSRACHPDHDTFG
jgi:hypothetical protein